jgi:hypothetical protein
MRLIRLPRCAESAVSPQVSMDHRVKPGGDERQSNRCGDGAVGEAMNANSVTRLLQPPRKPKHTAAQFAARFAAEKARQQRRYCEAFRLWLTCRDRSCRRHRACKGDPAACLKRAVDVIPRETQWRARQAMLAATAASVGAPERAARQCMPRDFFEETTAAVVARYLTFYERKS